MRTASWVRAAAVGAALLAAAAAHAQEKLEIFSWLTGDGNPALQALVQLYNERFPDVAVTNAAAATGAEGDPRTALKMRMLAGNPPDTFEVRGGQALIRTWVAANLMEDVAGFYRMQGWSRVLPRSFVALLSTKKAIWSVPLAVNRTNVIWFIPSHLATWGVQPPKTWDELLADCRRLRDGGFMTPLIAAESWNGLWESAALATMGPASWDGLWSGRIRFTDPRAVPAWNAFSAAADFAARDVPDLSVRQAMDRLVNGEAAFAIVDDRAEAYLAGTLKLTPGKDFGWAPAPGTAGVFMASTETYCLPRGAKNRASILKWLVLVGSREGQDAYDPLAGAISPRLDSDLSRYDPYGRSAAADWRKDTIVGSMSRGTVAPPSFLSRFADAVAISLSSKDAAAAARAAQAVADETGLGE